MAKRIYVGNLPFAATTQDLETSFGQFGEVLSTHIASDRETGRSRGFGFIEMAEDASADEAIQALNGGQYLGRQIVVSEARAREERPAGFRGAPRSGGSDRPRTGTGGGMRGYQREGGYAPRR